MDPSVVGVWGSTPHAPGVATGLMATPDRGRGSMPAPPLAADELWVIAKAPPPPGGGHAEEAARDTETPGSGAMLAMLPPADPVPGEDPEPQRIPLPLKHTDVQARVDGYISTVDVNQQFENPFAEKIEAVYVFPLPQDAAVSEFVMTIGDRRIRGMIRERAEAERIYHEARAQGYRAALLTQERPNIFTQRVANIEPGKRINVNIRYFNTLAYEDGWYSFVFPMVVGPRFNPPSTQDPIDAVSRGTPPGRSKSVPYLRPTERSGHDIAIGVQLSSGVAVEQVVCNTHDVSAKGEAASPWVSLAQRATIPNKDFVLRFRVAGDRIKSALMTHRDAQGGAAGGGYFTAMLYPPAELDTLRRQPMEMVFVLDCSGSMSGSPMTQSKAAVRHALDQLAPNDTFQIIRFSDNASRFGDTPVEATAGNVRKAKRYVDQLSGQGGTHMLEGIKSALDFPHDPQRFRVVTFLTDGYIGNEHDILAAVHEKVGDARIFSFGVGSSANRYLLDRMARAGRGAAAYLLPAENGEDVMDACFARISRPAMTDLQLDFGNMQVTEVYPDPRHLPDLFVGRPVVITGRFTGEPDTITVTGRAAGQAVRVDIAPSDDAQHPALAQVWARRKIMSLHDRAVTLGDPDGELAGVIKQTALDYSLMSAYTAFLAVDATARTAGSHGTTVHQALPMPDGVRYETTVPE